MRRNRLLDTLLMRTSTRAWPSLAFLAIGHDTDTRSGDRVRRVKWRTLHRIVDIKLYIRQLLRIHIGCSTHLFVPSISDGTLEAAFFVKRRYLQEAYNLPHRFYNTHNIYTYIHVYTDLARMKYTKPKFLHRCARLKFIKQ